MDEQRSPLETQRSRRRARLDEVGEGSFPASDPPQSWTWDVRDERDERSGRFSAPRKHATPAR